MDLMRELHIVIADDHPIVRRGLRQVIEAAPGLKVVGEADDGEGALVMIRTYRPHVVVLDIDMPGMDGFEVARAMLAQGLTDATIIFLTIHREEDFLNEALKLRGQGYVLKDSAIADIVTGIRTVAAGQNYTSPAMTTALINSHRRAVALHQNTPSFNDLTRTERSILQLIAEYKTSKEIADELCISHRTVETHRSNMSGKLEIHGSHALMKFALAHKSEL
jgi:two-component system, NarL family, response regulator DegU